MQYESLDFWISFGIDSMIDMIPFGKEESYLKFFQGENINGLCTSVETMQEGHKLFGVMPIFANLLVRKGHQLMIDEVLTKEDELKNYVLHLKNFTVYYIGIFL